MNQPLQEAIMINNEGAHLLSCGNASGALHSFQSAIATMKTAASSSSHTGAPRTACQNYRAYCSLFKLEQRPDVPVGLQKNEQHYVYNRPLLISTDFEILSEVDQDAFVHTSSTCVIFNFALACHQLGKSSGHEASLRRAGQLYSLTLKTLSGRENISDLHAVLQCLALNNLAQLHYDQCDYQGSQSCMETMYELVTTTDCLQVYLDETEAEEIMLNLFVQVKPPSVARAA